MSLTAAAASVASRPDEFCDTSRASGTGSTLDFLFGVNREEGKLWLRTRSTLLLFFTGVLIG